MSKLREKRKEGLINTVDNAIIASLELSISALRASIHTGCKIDAEPVSLFICAFAPDMTESKDSVIRITKEVGDVFINDLAKLALSRIIPPNKHSLEDIEKVLIDYLDKAKTRFMSALAIDLNSPVYTEAFEKNSFTSLITEVYESGNKEGLRCVVGTFEAFLGSTITHLHTLIRDNFGALIKKKGVGLITRKHLKKLSMILSFEMKMIYMCKDLPVAHAKNMDLRYEFILLRELYPEVYSNNAAENILVEMSKGASSTEEWIQLMRGSLEKAIDTILVESYWLSAETVDSIEYEVMIKIEQAVNKFRIALERAYENIAFINSHKTNL